MKPLDIDGSQGEGGGQILRTSLALSLIHSRPIHLRKIRKGRSRSGLLRQHLTATQAAQQVGAARVEGAVLGSTELLFEPQTILGGDYHFRVGSAGSALLVLQTVLPALLQATESTRLVLEGGTHNPAAPTFEFLARTFLPLLVRQGARVSAELERPGFFPAGGGKVVVKVEAQPKLQPLTLLDRGSLLAKSATVVVSRLPDHVAEREIRELQRGLDWPQDSIRTARENRSPGPGNVILVEVESESLTEVFSSFGRRGRSAEQVAKEAVQAVRAYLASTAPVGEHLADQLLLPFALAGGGSYRTLDWSRHARTNVDVMKHFLELDCHVEREEKHCHRVEMTVRGLR